MNIFAKMKIINKIKAVFLFNKIKALDSKYYVVLCNKWRELDNLDEAWFFPYYESKVKPDLKRGEETLSVGLKAMLNGNIRKNCIVLVCFEKEDELVVKEYLQLKTGRSDIIVP